MLIILSYFAISGNPYNVYNCSSMYVNFSSGRLYTNPDTPLCSNMTFINFSLADNTEYGYLHTSDIQDKAFLNITYVNSRFTPESKRREVLAHTGSAYRDIHMTFVNCEIWQFFRDQEMELAAKEITFIDCVLNITRITDVVLVQTCEGKKCKWSDRGRRGVIFGAPKIAFRNCTFVGKVKDEKHSFINLIRDQNTESYTIDFTDCVFDMDTDYNASPADGSKSNTRQFITINDMLYTKDGQEKRIDVVLNFVRCTTGKTLRLKEDPLHLVRVVTTFPVAQHTDIRNIGIKINEGASTTGANGIGVAFSVVDAANKVYSDNENTTWIEAFSNKKYVRTTTPQPGVHTYTPTPTLSTAKDSKVSIPWKVVSFVAAGLFVVTLIVLIVTCVKKRKLDISN